LRSKEDAHDYRYFPEPDLLTLVVSKEKIKELEISLPELPNKRMMRYLKDYGLSRFDAGLLIDNICRGMLFEEVVSLGASPKSAANWLNGDVARLLGERSVVLENTNLSKQGLFSLLRAIDKGMISNTAGKTVLEEIMFSQKTVDEVISEKGLVQVSDEDTLNKTVMKILSTNQKAVGEYKAGKTNVLGFLVGQCLRETRGKGNPSILKDLLVKAIDENA
jgi:aspartyl-tRNA(Asn)/glutamyl-tRNA(Gln) amidotransferase subunit B